eukprot:11012148-Lingulodinium_polyedra.AAC.1
MMRTQGVGGQRPLGPPFSVIGARVAVSGRPRSAAATVALPASGTVAHSHSRPRAGGASRRSAAVAPDGP